MRFDTTSNPVQYRGHGKWPRPNQSTPTGTVHPVKGDRLAYAISAAYNSASGAAELRWRAGMAGSERLDDHQHDDGGEKQHGGFVEDPEPAFAALVGEGLELAQQRP